MLESECSHEICNRPAQKLTEEEFKFILNCLADHGHIQRRRNNDKIEYRKEPS